MQAFSSKNLLLRMEEGRKPPFCDVFLYLPRKTPWLGFPPPILLLHSHSNRGENQAESCGSPLAKM